MAAITEEIQQRLFALQDLAYKSFQCGLLPTVPPETVIGVRLPELRKLARELCRTPEKAEAYLLSLPHTYYDENNLHGILLSQQKDYTQTVAALEAFLPFVDNWATCDTICPKAFQKHPDKLLGQVQKWMSSEHEFTIRFGIGVLLRFYLDDAFQPEHLSWVSRVPAGTYYVDMMAAWYFATALAKQYSAVLPYLEQRCLHPWTHNKAIQKAVESRRITEEQKRFLKSLRV